MIQVTNFVLKLIIMQKVGSVVELTCLLFLVIVDTRTVVFVVTMELAGLKVDISPSSYGVVHQTLLMKKKGGGNTSMRQFSETGKKQLNKHVIRFVYLFCF